MQQQVITIAPDGTISGLQVKPGKGVDLQSLGRAIGVPAKTVRASEIAWDETEQAWFIDVLQEVGRGPVTLQKHCLAFGGNPEVGHAALESLGVQYRLPDDWKEPIYFTSYDDAVKVEISYLNALRREGKF